MGPKQANPEGAPNYRESQPLRVLHIAPTFYPATYWGGPIFSTKMICEAVSEDPDFGVNVLTTDAAGPGRNERLVVGPGWQHYAPGYRVKFFRRQFGHATAPALLGPLIDEIRRADVVHLTSAYSFPVLPTLLAARTLGKPLVWSPRGAIQATLEWSNAPKRRFKNIYHSLAYHAAPKNLVVHATADSEALACEAAMPGVKTVIIPNGVDVPPLVESNRIRHNDSKVRLLFMSRIHPKKGLDRLIDAMSDLPDHFQLAIYGTGDPGYIKDLKQRAAPLGPRVDFMGHVDGDDKRKAFEASDLFVLPSFSENFGIVVAEALAHAVPVLTTNATPWRRLAEIGCGTVIDASNDDIARSISELAAEDLAGMGARGRTWMLEEYSREAVGQSFRKLYRSLAEQGRN